MQARGPAVQKEIKHGAHVLKLNMTRIALCIPAVVKAGCLSCVCKGSSSNVQAPAVAKCSHAECRQEWGRKLIYKLIC